MRFLLVCPNSEREKDGGGQADYFSFTSLSFCFHFRLDARVSDWSATARLQLDCSTDLNATCHWTAASLQLMFKNTQVSSAELESYENVPLCPAAACAQIVTQCLLTRTYQTLVWWHSTGWFGLVFFFFSLLTFQELNIENSARQDSLVSTVKICKATSAK